MRGATNPCQGPHPARFSPSHPGTKSTTQEKRPRPKYRLKKGTYWSGGRQVNATGEQRKSRELQRHPGRGAPGRARNEEHRWELTRLQLEDVSQSGDGPGGAGTGEEDWGETVRYRNGTDYTRKKNVGWSGGLDGVGALKDDHTGLGWGQRQKAGVNGGVSEPQTPPKSKKDE